MLVFLSITDVAAELWALVLSMSLELSKSLPDNLRATFVGFRIILPASMWELTEVNTVSEDLVDFLHEVSSSLTVGAADIKLWSHEHFILVLFATTSCVHSVESTFVARCLVDNVSVSIHELLMGLNE